MYKAKERDKPSAQRQALSSDFYPRACGVVGLGDNGWGVWGMGSSSSGHRRGRRLKKKRQGNSQTHLHCVSPQLKHVQTDASLAGHARAPEVRHKDATKARWRQGSAYGVDAFRFPHKA